MATKKITRPKEWVSTSDRLRAERDNREDKVWGGSTRKDAHDRLRRAMAEAASPMTVREYFQHLGLTRNQRCYLYVCLSGRITPSWERMVKIAERCGLDHAILYGTT